MLAWMYKAGTYVEVDAERCQVWLEHAANKGYTPAKNDLAVLLLMQVT